MEIKIYDVIYDNDAYISGIVIGQQNDEFRSSHKIQKKL